MSLKRVLVMCSTDACYRKHIHPGRCASHDSRDFPVQVSSILGANWKKEWEVTFLSPKCRKSKFHIRGFFPEDAPREKFDMLWFCGCDGVIFPGAAPILQSNEIKKRLTRNGTVIFTDMRGVFPHERNILIENVKRSSWLLDLRAYIDDAKRNKQFWKKAMVEDVNTQEFEFTKEVFDKVVEHLKKTTQLVADFMKHFKRTRQGTYKLK